MSDNSENEDIEESLEVPLTKQKKPRSQAQIEAFEKVKEKRRQNLEAKKQEKLINDYDISHLKLYINEKKLEHDYNLLRLKFENDNKIFKIYKNFFLLLDETIDKNFTDKYKIFIDEYEEEYEKIKKILEEEID